MRSFEILLKESADVHGHLCPGQVVGVRMAMLGCRVIGLDEPTRRDQIKKLIVFVEMDRCTADAVSHVTGVKLGRRSLKFMDYGIMAATFLNLETQNAYRVVSTEEARDLAGIYAPEVSECFISCRTSVIPNGCPFIMPFHPISDLLFHGWEPCIQYIWFSLSSNYTY